MMIRALYERYVMRFCDPMRGCVRECVRELRRNIEFKCSNCMLWTAGRQL
jgi:hypothetical protein